MVSCTQHSDHHQHHHQKQDTNHLLLNGGLDGESPDASSSDNHGAKNRRQQDRDEQQNNRTTDGQTMMHILKANIGTGVLAMPNAFKNVGLWLGFIMVPIIGAICIHCMNILISSHNHLCDRFNYESLDYDQVAALGLACGPKIARRLAKWAHIVVTTFLIFTQVGFCCVYIMFVVENVQLAVLNLFQVHYSTTTYLLLFFPIIGLTSCTSNLKHLARISTLANILQFTGLALIFFDLIQFHAFSDSSDSHLTTDSALPGSTDSTSGGNSSSSSSSTSLLYSSNATTPQLASDTTATSSSFVPKIQVSQGPSQDIANGLPLFFATAVYAFEGIGVVLPLIKEMQHPDRISGTNGVLNTSMSMVAILYMGMGFFGYAKYGQFVQGSITLNLPETTLNELVRVIFAVAIGLSYSLQFYVPWTIIWPFIDESLFYSYRPRESRDKLGILNKLSAENEWALEESDVWQPSGSCQQKQSSATTTNHHDDQHQLSVGEQAVLDLDGDSNASTFATSYAGSTSYQQSTRITRRHLNLSTSLAATGNNTLASYGSIKGARTGCATQDALGNCSLARRTGAGHTLLRRNRLEDVMEQEDDDSMPEVQWRPPPRSMRGKRKLVRYTVILLSVSFTFVAAALIPRLDLFIALIGALASSCLAIIFPAIIQACTFWQDGDYNGDDDDDGDNNKCAETLAGMSRRKRILWWLFVGKNLLLILFGILGLITGSWISLSKLSAVYMGIEPDEA